MDFSHKLGLLNVKAFKKTIFSYKNLIKVTKVSILKAYSRAMVSFLS